MNVLFISHDSGLYGANRSLLSLVQGLKQFGVNSYVVCPSEGDFTEELHRQGIHCKIIPIQLCMAKYDTGNKISIFLRRMYEVLARFYNTLKVLPTLAKYAYSNNIDLVYTNSSVTIMGILLAKIIKKPHVWHFREFAKLHYNYKLDFPIFIYNKLIRSSNANVFISKALKNYFINKNKLNCNNYIIYNGIYPENQLSINKAISISKDYIFLMVGLVSENKGQMDAIMAISEVIKKYPKTKLLIIGGGDIETCQKLIAEHQLFNNVEFVGYITDVDKYYKESDALLMCSKYEAMGRVTAEAMSHGLPVIGRDSGGTSELINHNNTGLLYDGSVKQLKEMMILLMENNDLHDRIRVNAFKFAKENFTVEKYVQNVFRVIQEALQ